MREATEWPVVCYTCQQAYMITKEDIRISKTDFVLRPNGKTRRAAFLMNNACRHGIELDEVTTLVDARTRYPRVPASWLKDAMLEDDMLGVAHAVN